MIWPINVQIQPLPGPYALKHETEALKPENEALKVCFVAMSYEAWRQKCRD
jgi:hypothetical protein